MVRKINESNNSSVITDELFAAYTEVSILKFAYEKKLDNLYSESYYNDLDEGILKGRIQEIEEFINELNKIISMVK